VTLLRVAHRAANDAAALVAAAAAGADLAEGDVHLRRGRLEVRHAKSLGPLPWHWEPWYLVRPTAIVLADLAPHLAGRPTVLLDLKGWQPWLGTRVRDEMAALAPGLPYAVCSRHWRMLDAFHGVDGVRVLHSVRTRRALRRLPARLRRAPTWGVVLHADLLTATTVARLQERADVVLTWPVPTPDAWRRAAACGVDGAVADDLAVLPA
jgi:glycerophosphoryl diester phosphodiesterase